MALSTCDNMGELYSDCDLDTGKLPGQAEHQQVDGDKSQGSEGGPHGAVCDYPSLLLQELCQP